jgi:hypothetical protein
MSEMPDTEWAEDDATPAPEPQALTLRPHPATLVPDAPPEPPQALQGIDPYHGIAMRPFSEKATAILAKYTRVPDDWLDITPGGQIYLPHMKLRKILNEAFERGGWGSAPASDIHVERKPTAKAEKVTVYREYAFYAEGRFVRQAMGAGEYFTNNRDSNHSDAVEASESYALNRFGKFLGIAEQCWEKDYIEQWKRDFATQRDDKWSKKPQRLQAEKKPSGEGSSTRVAAPTQPEVDDVSSSRPASGPDPSPELFPKDISHVRCKILSVRDNLRNPNAAQFTNVDGDAFWLFGKKHHIDAKNALSEGLFVTFDWSWSADKKFRNVSNFVVESVE